VNLVSGRRDQLTMLTVAERRVAKLVVEGLRNREIAAALGKSITTVKSQLAAISGNEALMKEDYAPMLSQSCT
jgi:DNA-binding NarL/FixJ family response regulator